MPLPPPQSRAELAREERSTLLEAAKDRWNDEVENAVRWVQRTDWNEVREGMEGAVSRLLGSGLQKSREGIEEAEKQATPKVQEAVDRSKRLQGRVLIRPVLGLIGLRQLPSLELNVLVLKQRLERARSLIRRRSNGIVQA